MKRRVLGLLLAAVLLLGVATPAFADIGLDNFQKSEEYANQFADVPADSWFAENVKAAYEYGLMTGTSTTTFNPTGVLSVAEVIVIACRLYSIYYQFPSDFRGAGPWYQGYVDYANETGITQGMFFSDYTAPATRAQMAQILAKSVSEKALPAINRINYIPDVAKEQVYSQAVYLLYNAGILTGSDEQGSFRPESNITRAEVAAIVTRIADTSLRKEFSLPNQAEESEPVDATAELLVGEISVPAGSEEKLGTSKDVVWTSSDPSVADVTPEGLVIARAGGTAYITAAAGDVEYVCEVSVTDDGGLTAETMNIQLYNDTGSYPVDYVTAGYFYRGAHSIWWPERIYIDGYLFTTKGSQEMNGSGGIIFSRDLCGYNHGANLFKDFQMRDDVTGWCVVEKGGYEYYLKFGTSGMVEVYRGNENGPAKDITSVELDRSELEIKRGEKELLTLSVLPADANNRCVQWHSSDPAIVTVDKDGVIRGVQAGTAVITAVSGGRYDTCTVAVLDADAGEEDAVPVRGVEFLVSDAEVALRSSICLLAETYPAHATDTEIVYTSSDPSIATVDAHGGVVGISEGTVTITAAAGQASAACTVKVIRIPVTNVTLSEVNIYLRIGENSYVTASAEPFYNTDISPASSFEWRSSDPSVATVSNMDNMGVISAVSEGTARIYAKAGDAEGFCTVVVTKVPVTGVDLYDSESAVKVGDTKRLSVTIQSQDASAKTLVWTSSDPSVATVDQDGNVTGVAEGIATITVHGDGVSDSCIVNVYEKLVIQVVLLPAHSVLPLGRTGELVATIVMMEDAYVSAQWTSSDPSIVTVDQEGVVTGVSVGRATITVTVDGISASCVVDVQEIPIGLDNFTRSKEYQDQFNDVKSSDWFTENVALAYEYGLMTGTAADTFNPSGKLTVAETIVIACRIHNTYYGSLHTFEAEEGDAWYQPYVDYALLYGLVGVDEYSDYTAVATRANFASILARSVPEEELPAINEFEMVPDVDVEADYAYSVYLLYWAGVLSGSDAYGSFNPDSTITRAEVAAIVTRIVDPSLRRTFTLENHPAKYYYEDVLELRNTVYNGLQCAQQAMNQMNDFLNQTDGSRYNSLQYAYTQFGYSLGSMKMALTTMEAKDPIYLEGSEYETLAEFARSICDRIEEARAMSYTMGNIALRFYPINEKYSDVYNDYAAMNNLLNRLVSKYQ